MLIGCRLVDQLMVPFENCYLLIYALILPMLAGNQALPLFMRLEMRLLTKFVRKGSELDISLHFLLAHSRRQVPKPCYVLHIRRQLTVSGCSFTSFPGISPGGCSSPRLCSCELRVQSHQR